MRSLPGVDVVSPCDLWETKEATRAIAARSGVAYLRLDKSVAEESATCSEGYEIGKVRCIKDGDDLTLAATGGILGEVQKAAEELESEGIHARVLSVHTIKPLDKRAFELAARETGGIITIEEHTVDGGLGGAVAESLLESDYRPSFFHRIGLRNGFSSIVGSQSYLREQYCMDANAIRAKAIELLRSNARVPSQPLAA